MSDLDKEVVLWLLGINEMQGTVPTLWQLKNATSALEKTIGINVKKHSGSLGHTYYVFHPSSHVQLVMCLVLIPSTTNS
jgi:hypothetical protein